MSAPQLHVSPNSLRMTPHVGSDGISLALSNPAADKSVLYKCKTTSPARYVVRNRQGVIAPGGQQTVLITLQRGVVITGEEEMDIFLVESRYLDAGEVESAARTENVSSELMKAKGRSAVGKIQVKCELSLGAAASAAPAAAPPSQSTQRGTNDGLVSEAPSTHTQPERVSSTNASSTVQQRPTASVDPSPAPRDPALGAGNSATATPLQARATTSVRAAPVKPKKSGSKKYIIGAVVVIAAAYFAGFIGGTTGGAEESAAAAPAAEAPVTTEPTTAAASNEKPAADKASESVKKSSSSSSKSAKKKTGGSKSA